MGNSYSAQELKQKIQQDLKIDVAFPFFPLGRKTGSSACCVVNFSSLCNHDKKKLKIYNYR